MVDPGLIGLTGLTGWIAVDRRGRMSVANPTFEEMARHWFNTFVTNPSVESFARSRSWF
jgi:hypothetical protein